MTEAELERLLGRPVTRVRRERFAYASSHPLARLDVELADGGTLPLVEKDTRELLPAAAGAKPRFLRDPCREIEVYREVLAGAGVPAPAFVGAVGSSLVVERVDGTPLTEVGELAVWQRAAAELARLHRHLRGRGSERLLRCDVVYYARWLERARALAGVAVDAFSEAYAAAAQRLLRLPRAVIHGELYPSNVVVAGKRVCFLDWETAALGPPLLDLAALTSGPGWSEAQRVAIVAAYAAKAEVDPRDLDACRLVVAVQWLGWSATWSPPAPQRHDWLAAAREAAGALA